LALVGTSHENVVMRPGKVTPAGRVRAGDEVLHEGRFAVVTAIRKAQGRKPRTGENLHVVMADKILKINSAEPVRVQRAAT
jgi:hypothetical protein